MPPKKASIQDIADRVGVSKALVSFVLNGKGKEHRISEEMSKKVLDVARDMNYKPNQIAKWLRSGKTQTIGLIIADISNPFFGKLGREIEREASKKGYKIVFCSSDENIEKSARQLEMLMKSHVDGFIISPPPGSSAQIEALAKTKIPYVLVDRYFPEIESNYVVIDNFDAAYKATDYLIKKGYRRIAFLTVNDELITMHNRTEGYLGALNDAGLLPEHDLVYKLPFSHDKTDVNQAIMKLTSGERKMDALLFSSSKIGLMGLECIMEMGFNIPGDFALVSFDDPDFYKVCYSPVSAIAQPLAEMAGKAVRILTDEIETGKLSNPSKKVILKSNFIARKSTGS